MVYIENLNLAVVVRQDVDWYAQHQNVVEIKVENVQYMAPGMKVRHHLKF